MGMPCSMHREREFIHGFGMKARKRETTGRPTHRQRVNSKMDREIGWDGMD
jgi:hypothetical protein